MKLHTWATGLALAVCAGLGLGGPAAADAVVPFQGSLTGHADGSGFPSVVVHATGHATQLGQFALTMPHVVNPPANTAAGTFEFVAANGDTLFGTQTGVATLTATPNLIFIVETATITGGTGRFADATGGFTIERLYDRVSGATAGLIQGTLSAPGAGG
jgi:hypothetical protein